MRDNTYNFTGTGRVPSDINALPADMMPYDVLLNPSGFLELSHDQRFRTYRLSDNDAFRPDPERERAVTLGDGVNQELFAVNHNLSECANHFSPTAIEIYIDPVTGGTMILLAEGISYAINPVDRTVLRGPEGNETDLVPVNSGPDARLALSMVHKYLDRRDPNAYLKYSVGNASFDLQNSRSRSFGDTGLLVVLLTPSGQIRVSGIGGSRCILIRNDGSYQPNVLKDATPGLRTTRPSGYQHDTLGDNFFEKSAFGLISSQLDEVSEEEAILLIGNKSVLPPELDNDLRERIAPVVFRESSSAQEIANYVSSNAYGRGFNGTRTLACVKLPLGDK